MQDKKESKAKIQIIFSALLLSVVFIAEIYAIVNYPEQYIFIASFAVAFLIVLYILINGLFSLHFLKKQRREEQYDNIFKSEKASYLMLKKHFEDIDDKINILMKIAKVPTEEIINTQKGIAKVIINRSRENAEALMNSNDILLDKVDEFNKMLTSNNDGLLDAQKGIINENINQLVIKQQEIEASMKDMELRLNQAIMQTQQIISSQPVQLTAKVDIPQQPVTVQMPAMQAVAPVIQPVPAPVYAEQPVAPAVEPEAAAPEVEPEVAVEPEAAAPEVEPVIEEPAPVVEEVIPELEIEPIVEEPVVEESVPVVEEVIPEPEVAVEPVVEEVPVVEEPVVEEPTPVVEEVIPEPEVEPIVEEEPIVEPEPVDIEVPPAPDMSDPNKKMSPDDIAALFASMGAAEEPVAVAEPVVEEPPVEEPQVEPEPAEPEPATEPIIEEAAPETPAGPDLSDPNKPMSPDEIAALIANMGVDDGLDEEPEVSAEPEVVAEPEVAEPEPVVEEATEEKPQMPDLSDPNKVMSPDEIAALIANM